MLTDKEGNVTPTGPVGPAGFRWTYLGPYGGGPRFLAAMYKAEGQDDLYFLKVGEKAPYETVEGTLDLVLDRDELDETIAELVWLRDNWNNVGRGA